MSRETMQRWAFLLAVVIVAGVLLGLSFVVAEVLLPRGS